MKPPFFQKINIHRVLLKTAQLHHCTTVLELFIARIKIIYYFQYIIILLTTMTYNQVQSFRINDYVNHFVDIEITGYRELLYSKSWKTANDNVYMCIVFVCVRTCACVCVLHELLYQELMLAITQSSYFSDLVIITTNLVD